MNKWDELKDYIQNSIVRLEQLPEKPAEDRLGKGMVIGGLNELNAVKNIMAALEKVEDEPLMVVQVPSKGVFGGISRKTES